MQPSLTARSESPRPKAALAYNPALDGLRAVAVVLVVLFHARVPGFSGGSLGVDAFFVLSGFLITTLIVNEVHHTGRLDYWHFMQRRFLRLAPALFAMLLAYVIIAPMFWPGERHLLQALIAATYLSDFTITLWEFPRQLGHTWSLAVEAQFYLLWPLVLVAANRRVNVEQLFWVLLALYLVAVAWRCWSLLTLWDWRLVYFRFDTRLSGLILGAVLAVLLKSDMAERAVRRARWFLWVPLLAVVCLNYKQYEVRNLLWGVTVMELATAVILLVVQRPRNVIYRLLAIAPLVWIGRLSYGIYLWHYPIFRYLRDIYSWHWVLLIGVPLSVGLAALSFVSVERWGSRLRRAPPVGFTDLAAR